MHHRSDGGPGGVGDLGRHVEATPDTMAAELSDDSIAVAAARVGRDGCTDVADVLPGGHLLDAQLEAVAGDVYQIAGLRLDLADQEHLGGVAVEAVQVSTHVDVDDVACTETARQMFRFLRFRMSGDTKGKALVVQGGGVGPMLDDEVVAEPVQLVGAHSRHHVGADEVEHLSNEPAVRPHLDDFVRAENGQSRGKSSVKRSKLAAPLSPGRLADEGNQIAGGEFRRGEGGPG